ncbi:hypothetical protein CCACVL1_24455 [Corchorus capsularis]|uniref:CRIB domain-containing protein n=1 Tax=Corchorus capsularis TaxID=210143 RepID=A0A1R3GPK7_COCAP|nr:hypothetical protein CCACVL1_24455 [Corchorus capsularis]
MDIIGKKLAVGSKAPYTSNDFKHLLHVGTLLPQQFCIAQQQHLRHAQHDLRRQKSSLSHRAALAKGALIFIFLQKRDVLKCSAWLEEKVHLYSDKSHV